MDIVFKDAVCNNSDHRKYKIEIKTIKGESIHARFETCDQIGVLVVLEKDEKPKDSKELDREMFYPWCQIESIRL